MDKSLFVADKINNKIRQVDLNVFTAITFATNVDLKGLRLQGLAIDSTKDTLYAAVTAGIYSYKISLGSSSKVIYAGQISAGASGVTEIGFLHFKPILLKIITILSF